jgi:hypothetical protein
MMQIPGHQIWDKPPEVSIHIGNPNGTVLLKLKPNGDYELPASIDDLLHSPDGVARAFGRALKDAKDGRLQ